MYFVFLQFIKQFCHRVTYLMIRRTNLLLQTTENPYQKCSFQTKNKRFTGRFLDCFRFTMERRTQNGVIEEGIKVWAAMNKATEIRSWIEK